MKYKIIFPLVFFCSSFFAQKKVPFICWKSNANFDKLISPGKKHVFIQKCDLSTDTLISNGLLQFLNAGVANIKKCRLTFLVNDTILISSEIEVSGKNSVNECEKYLSDLIPNYDKPFTSVTLNRIRYRTWFALLDGRKVIVRYTSNINGKKGSLIVEPDFRN